METAKKKKTFKVGVCSNYEDGFCESEELRRHKTEYRQISLLLTNFMVCGTRRFNASFSRALQ